MPIVAKSKNQSTKPLIVAGAVAAALQLSPIAQGGQLTYDGTVYNVGVTDFSVDTETFNRTYWQDPNGDPSDFQNSYSFTEVAGWTELSEEYEDTAPTQSNYDAWYTLVSAQPWFYDTSDLATVEQREAFWQTNNSSTSDISVAALADLSAMPDVNDEGGRAILWVLDSEGTDLGGYPIAAVYFQYYDGAELRMKQANTDPAYLFDKTYYVIVPTLSAVSSTSTLKNSPGVGGAVVIDATSDLLQLLIDADLTGDREISNAVSSTLPLLTGAGIEGARSALTSINRVIQARIEGVNVGMSSGDAELDDDNYMWIKPFGSWADQDDVLAVSGFESHTTGAAIGLDNVINETTRLGLAFAHANAGIDSNSTVAPQTADVDLYQLVAYGSKALSADTELNFQIDYGTNSTNARRSIAFTNSVASSSYDSAVAHAALGIGKTYTVNGGDSFVASLRGDYTLIKDDGYVETGAGDLNLSVNERTAKEFVFSVDGKYLHALNETTTLTGKIGAGYDTINERASLTAAYAGAPTSSFVTDGLKPDPFIGKVGLGLFHQTDNGTQVTIDYDAEIRDGYLNQTASLKARWAF